VAGKAEAALGDEAGGVPGHHTRLPYKDSNGTSEIFKIKKTLFSTRFNSKKNYYKNTKLNL